MRNNILPNNKSLNSEKTELLQDFERLYPKFLKLYQKKLFEEAFKEVSRFKSKFRSVAAYHNILGKINHALSDSEKAIVSFKKAVEIDSQFVEAHNNLGSVLTSKGMYAEAELAYSKAIEISPTYMEAHNNFGIYWSKLGHFQKALASFSVALKINPNLAEIYNNIAIVFMKMNRLEDAIDMLKKSLHFNPLYADALNNLGNAFKTQGRFKEATHSYKRALEEEPFFCEAFFNLVQINELASDDPLKKRMEDKLVQSRVSKTDKMLLSFSLGKVFDDLGKYAVAFSYFKEANAMREALGYYQLEHDASLVMRIKNFFTKHSFTKSNVEENFPENRHKAIFIVGMPRSGTTLIEQILSSHAEVSGLGELSILGNLANGIDFNNFINKSELDKKVRKPYLQYLDNLKKNTIHLVDKMPFNFLWIGLIAVAIPEAKIIHVKRDARAVCWSIYRHLFWDNASEFSYSFKNIASFYKLYVEIMKFWHLKFPDSIYDLNYDDLIKSQVTITRDLLTYLDLEFSQSCIDFHETQRSIATASAKQVRQGLFQGSSDNWRKYESNISNLVQDLKGY